MSRVIVMAIFLAGFSNVAADDYTEVRDLIIDAGDLDELLVFAGPGSLDVSGVDGLERVEVKATIVIPDADEDDGKAIVAKDLTLSLEQDGEAAVLTSDFDQSFWGGNSNGRIDLEVRAPHAIAVTIDDGSGSMDVSNFSSEVEIDDGSGSIDVRNVGSLHIEDGSGSIDVVGATGDVTIDDGSGGITVNEVGGSVIIDDGSGGIRVSDVAKDLIILEDGSGGVSFSDVRGTVKEDG